MVGYVIGEMWIGVCVAVVLDIVPPDLTTSAVSVYFFTIQIIGANMPLFVTPITDGLSLRAAMLICFPGFYLVGALFFLITFFLIKKKDKNVYEFGNMAKENNYVKDNSASVQEFQEIDKSTEMLAPDT